MFNRDIGTIEKIDPVEHEVSIKFDDRLVTYDFGELDEVSLAYAVTNLQVAGFGISSSRDSGGNATLHAASAQFDLHRNHPCQAIARG